MGGNIFKGKTKSIKKENIEETVSNYFAEMKRVFPKKKGIFNFQSVNEMHNFMETPVERRKKVRFHPTQKHEDLIEWLIKIGSNKNGLVLDLFAGSATTSRVAKKLGRNFIGVEDDEIYVKKSRKILNGVKDQKKI